MRRSFLEVLAASAAAAALFLAGISEPRFGPVAAFFSPAPVLLTALRAGAPDGAAALLLAAALSLPFVPSAASALSFPAGIGLPALLLGLLLRRRRGLVLSSTLAAGAALSLSFLASALHFHLADLEISTFLRYQAGDLVRETRTALEEISLGPSALPPGETARILDFVGRAMPSILLVTLVLQFAANGLLCLLFSARRRSAPRTPLPDLAAFRLPEHLIWLPIGALVLLWAPSAPLRTAALNVAVAVLFFYLLQGLSIVVHFLDRGKIGRPLRMILIILFLLQPLFLVLPLLAGLLDFKFDFRRRRAPPLEP